MANSSQKFYGIKLEELFYIRPEEIRGEPGKPKPHHLKLTGLIPCRKASALTYIVIPESVLGEMSYDPSIDVRIVTEAELAEAQKPAKIARCNGGNPCETKYVKYVKAKAAKKALKPVAQKSATKKAPAKKAAKKIVKKTTRR